MWLVVCARLRGFLTTGVLPPEEDQVQHDNLRKEAEEYCMYNGLLYRQSEQRDGPGLQLATPSSLRDRVVRMAHDSPIAIHPGASQMRTQIQRRHYWPGVQNSCTRYVKGCVSCQRAASAPATGTGQDQTQYFPIGKPLSVVAIDVVGPLGNNRSKTTNGNRFIVTTIDWFTRFVVMYPVPEPAAEEIGKCWIKLVARFGSPMTILSDNAQYF